MDWLGDISSFSADSPNPSTSSVNNILSAIGLSSDSSSVCTLHLDCNPAEALYNPYNVHQSMCAICPTSSTVHSRASPTLIGSCKPALPPPLTSPLEGRLLKGALTPVSASDTDTSTAIQALSTATTADMLASVVLSAKNKECAAELSDVGMDDSALKVSCWKLCIDQPVAIANLLPSCRKTMHYHRLCSSNCNVFM